MEAICPFQKRNDLVEALQSLFSCDILPVDGGEDRHQTESASARCNDPLIVCRIIVIHMNPLRRHPAIRLGAIPEILECLVLYKIEEGAVVEMACAAKSCRVRPRFGCGRFLGRGRQADNEEKQRYEWRAHLIA